MYFALFSALLCQVWKDPTLRLQVRLATPAFVGAAGKVLTPPGRQGQHSEPTKATLRPLVPQVPVVQLGRPHLKSYTRDSHFTEEPAGLRPSLSLGWDLGQIAGPVLPSLFKCFQEYCSFHLRSLPEKTWEMATGLG